MARARPTIYLLHGWAYSLDAWQPVVDGLAAAGWQVKLPPVPGLTDPDIDRPLTIDDYVGWLDRLLPARQPVILAGHSNGGRISLNYCQKTGGRRVRQLVLIGSAGIPPRPWRHWRNRAVSRLAALVRPLKLVPGLARLVHRFVGGGDYDRANPLMKQTLVNLLASDFQLDPSRVTAPTSLIWGTADSATPPWQAARLQQQLPNLRATSLVPGGGHNLHRSHPELLAELIDRQLQPLLEAGP